MLKRPLLKSPFWVLPDPLAALVSRTVPLRVSSVDPTGSWLPIDWSGTKPAAALPPTRARCGSFTSTVPFTGAALTVEPSVGGGGAPGLTASPLPCGGEPSFPLTQAREEPPPTGIQRHDPFGLFSI